MNKTPSSKEDFIGVPINAEDISTIFGWRPIAKPSLPSDLKSASLLISNIKTCESDNTNYSRKTSLKDSETLQKYTQEINKAYQQVKGNQLESTPLGQSIIATSVFTEITSQNKEFFKQTFHTSTYQVCAHAGQANTPTDSCQGDSGGPLISEQKGYPTLVGVVSHGPECAQPNTHGVYASTSAYADWIAAAMKGEKLPEGDVTKPNEDNQPDNVVQPTKPEKSSSSSGGSTSAWLLLILAPLMRFRKR